MIRAGLHLVIVGEAAGFGGGRAAAGGGYRSHVQRSITRAILVLQL